LLAIPLAVTFNVEKMFNGEFDMVFVEFE